MTKALQPGSVFAGRYEVLRLIGTGGMGAVYEVLHRETRRKRALKVLLPVLVSDPDARARFAQEASITAEIESEYLIDVFDAGVDEGTGCPFIVLELLKGQSLGEALTSGRRFSPHEVVEILRHAAKALVKTHAAGIVHRDLKPDNLFLTTREDGTPRTKILDFGIAKVAAQAGKSRNTVNIGTPLYMAPEQLDGSALDGRADLYSLGHIAFELLTGESYWEHEVRTAPSTMALLRWIERGLPEAPRVRAKRLGVQVGPDFDRWFVRATATVPAERYGSATDLAEGFAYAVGVPVAETSVSRPGLKLMGKTQPVQGQPEPAKPLVPSVTMEMQLPVGPGGAAAAAPPSFAESETLDRATRSAGVIVSNAQPPPPGTPMPIAEQPLSGVTGPRFTRSGPQGARSSAMIWVAIAGAIGLLCAGALVLGLGRPEKTEPSAEPRAASEAPAQTEAPVVTPEPSSAHSATAAASQSAATTPSASATASASTKRLTPRVPTGISAREALCRKEPHRCR